jgi:hypothetical protein
MLRGAQPLGGVVITRCSMRRYFARCRTPLMMAEMKFDLEQFLDTASEESESEGRS